MNLKEVSATQLLTSTQAAETLAISTRQLLRLKAAGTLPYVQMGRSVRYRLTDIASYIDSQTRQNETL